MDQEEAMSHVEWARLTNLRAGMEVEIDGGFPCHPGGIVTLLDDDGLYFKCVSGRHYLAGQLDENGHVVGVYAL